MAVNLPNSTVSVYRSDSELIPETVSNIQKTTKENIPPQFQRDVDQLPSYRIRLDLPVDSTDPNGYEKLVPTSGDTAFINECPRYPHLTGEWTILRIEEDTGELYSVLLFVDRKDVDQNGL